MSSTQQTFLPFLFLLSLLLLFLPLFNTYPINTELALGIMWNTSDLKYGAQLYWAKLRWHGETSLKKKKAKKKKSFTYLLKIITYIKPYYKDCKLNTKEMNSEGGIEGSLCKGFFTKIFWEIQENILSHQAYIKLCLDWGFILTTSSLPYTHKNPTTTISPSAV